MKKIIILIFFLCSAMAVSAQFEMDPPTPGGRKHKDRIDQLEKIKLAEELNLDDETLFTVFEIRDRFIGLQKETLDKRDSLVNKLDQEFVSGNTKVDDKNYAKYMKQLSDYELQIAKQRSEFIKSLEQVLSKENVVRYIVFEQKFRQMVRQFFMEGRGKGRGRK